MRIAIACSSLCYSRGGSERTAVNLAAAMAGRGHAVSVFSQKFKNRPAIPVYDLAPGIKHFAWDLSGRHAAIQQLREKLISENFDVFLSLQSDRTHLFWTLACLGTGVPLILSERCDPVLYTENRVWNRPGRVAALSGADFIHELLPIYGKSVPDFLNERLRIIPNAAPLSQNSRVTHLLNRPKSILFLARFDIQKRPLLLVDAFARIATRYPDWTLDLWGHGEQTAALREKIAKSGCANIRLHGESLNADMAYAHAQIYCLPSRYEGFPNSVLEAMQASLPIVGVTDCHAMADLIDGSNGVLADQPTPQSLAQALSLLMDSQELRESMGKAGHSMLAKYNPANIYTQWEKLFMEAAARKGHTILNTFQHEPFASMATLSAAARREYLYRNFGEAMPYSLAWWRERGSNLIRNVAGSIKSRLNQARNRERP